MKLPAKGSLLAGRASISTLLNIIDCGFCQKGSGKWKGDGDLEELCLRDKEQRCLDTHQLLSRYFWDETTKSEKFLRQRLKVHTFMPWSADLYHDRDFGSQMWWKILLTSNVGHHAVV